MQQHWLNQQHNRQCLLFFSGWGMQPQPFHALGSDSLDLCFFHDYREITPFSWEPFQEYEQLHLLAWSMGVWVAASLLAQHKDLFASCTALAGTLCPIDATKGIPPLAYQEMCDDFTHQTVTDFYHRMFDQPEHHKKFLAASPHIRLETLHDELLAFRESAQQPVENFYTRKIVTSRDRIFSAKNQMRAWGRKQCELINWPHFPFYHLTSWQDIFSIKK